MYEEMTESKLLNDKLALLPKEYDTRESAPMHILMDCNSIETAKGYIELDRTYSEIDIRTATRVYLKLWGSQFGIEIKPADNAQVQATIISTNSASTIIDKRFNLDEVNYTVIQSLGGDQFVLEAETAGTVGNITGVLTPIDTIPNFTSATADSIYYYGVDEEDTEVYRKRILANLQRSDYAFNKEGYKLTVKSLTGVGGCKVLRAPSGGGSVQVIITGEDNKPATTELISAVQTFLDPYKNGEGDGIVPIGHVCTVTGTSNYSVNIGIDAVYKNGTFTSAKEAIANAINLYFAKLISEWEKSNTAITISSSILIFYIMDNAGDYISDINRLSINGLGYGVNFSLPSIDNLPVLGVLAEV